MISVSPTGMTRFRGSRRYLAGNMHAVLERLRSRAFEALVLAFALGSVVEAFAAPHAHPHAIVAALALGWSLPFLWRSRHKFWAPLAVCADVALLALATSEQTVNALTMPFVALLGAAVSFGLVGER